MELFSSYPTDNGITEFTHILARNALENPEPSLAQRQPFELRTIRVCELPANKAEGQGTAPVPRTDDFRVQPELAGEGFVMVTLGR